MSESLEVTGYGPTRDKALADADRRAAEYFGPTVQTTREIGPATPVHRLVTGEVSLWSVQVVYRPAS